MTDKALTERVAKALTTACGRDPDAILNGVPEWIYRQTEAKAALAASDRADLVRRVDDLTELLTKSAPFVGWASARHQIVAGVDAAELCDLIDIALTQGAEQ